VDQLVRLYGGVNELTCDIAHLPVPLNSQSALVTHHVIRLIALGTGTVALRESGLESSASIVILAD
jgi:hypothetical protein